MNKKKGLAAIMAIFLSAVSIFLMNTYAIDTTKDPNGDGALNLNDAVYILQYLAGAIEPTDLSELDVNDNYVVSYVDYIEILYYDAYNSTGGGEII